MLNSLSAGVLDKDYVLLDEHLLYKWMMLQTADVMCRVIQIQFKLWLHNAAPTVSGIVEAEETAEVGMNEWMNERRVTQK